MSKLFDRIPNWVTLSVGFGGLPMSAFASRLPEKYQSIGLYVGLGLIALCIILYFIYPFGQRRKAKEFDSVGSHLERDQWKQDWHELRFRRSEFWRLINNCYGNWQSRVNDNIQKVIAESNFPSALPLADHNTNTSSSRALGAQSADTSGSATLLNAFSSFIYEPNASERFCLGFGNARSGFESFDNIRRDLSKFWDQWGGQEHIEKIIKDQQAEEMLTGSAAELKLLTFLELARAKWRPTEASDTHGLFYLASRANTH